MRSSITESPVEKAAFPWLESCNYAIESGSEVVLAQSTGITGVMS